MDKLNLKADKREVFGRKVKSLRRQNILPANIFGRKTDSLAIQVNVKEFEKVFKEAGETGLIEVLVDGKKKPVLVHDVHTDPVSDAFLHVDFVQVDLKEKIEAQVPVELRGESPAEKQSLGTVVQYEDELTVEALPTDLPDSFEIDISNLENVDDAVQVKDIKVNKAKVEIKEEADKILVKVEPPQKEEEVAPPPAEEEEEGEAPTEEKKEEVGEEKEQEKDTDK
jgi:large subunit ribosomal protein L25